MMGSRQERQGNEQELVQTNIALGRTEMTAHYLLFQENSTKVSDSGMLFLILPYGYLNKLHKCYLSKDPLHAL